MQVRVIRSHVVSRLNRESLFFGTAEFGVERFCDFAGHFALYPEDVLQFAIVTFAQRWSSVAALISCTLMCTALPAFCTLPSSKFATPSCWPTSRRLSGALLYFCVEVREMTLSAAMLDKRVRISS